MKSNLLITLLFFCLTGFAQSKQEQEVLQLSKAKFKWIVNKNMDSLQWVLDERLTFTHSNGWVQSKKELMDDLKSNKLTYTAIDVVVASVRLYAKSAVITGKGKFTVTTDGTSTTFDLAYTETYVLQKRDWKLVSRHASRAQ